MSHALFFLLAVLTACSLAVFFLSPQLKRKAGIWLIAKADAEDAARMYFAAQHREITKLYETTPS